MSSRTDVRDLYWLTRYLTSVRVDSQLAKGLAIMHHLKEAQGILDFKRLNELIKQYNNRK